MISCSRLNAHVHASVHPTRQTRQRAAKQSWRRCFLVSTRCWHTIPRVLLCRWLHESCITRTLCVITLYILPYLFRDIVWVSNLHHAVAFSSCRLSHETVYRTSKYCFFFVEHLWGEGTGLFLFSRALMTYLGNLFYTVEIRKYVHPSRTSCPVG